MPFLINIATGTTPASRGYETVFLWRPFQEFIRAEYSAGHFPLWLPHLNCGISALGFSHTGIFYPFNFYLAPISYAAASIPHFFFHSAVFVLGAYFLFKTTGLGRIASFFSAIAVSFTHATGYLHHLDTLAWFPTIALMAALFVRTGRLRYFLATIFFLAVSTTGGGVEELAYFMAWGMAGGLAFKFADGSLADPDFRKRIASLALASLPFFAVASPILLATMEFASQSVRIFGFTDAYRETLIHSWLPNPLVRPFPCSIIGLTALACAIYLIVKRTKSKAAAAMVLSIALFVVQPPPFDRLIAALPVFGIMSGPLRALPILIFWLVYLCAKSVAKALAGIDRRVAIASGAAFFALLSAGKAARWERNPMDVLDYDKGYAEFFTASNEPARSINLFSFPFKKGKKLPFPEQSGVLFGTQGIDSEISISPYYISKLQSALDNDLLKFEDGKLDRTSIKYALKTWNIARRGSFKIVNLMNLKYFVSIKGIETYQGDPLEIAYSGDGFVVYRNVDAYPRVALRRYGSLIPEDDEAVKKIADDPNFDPGTTVIFSKQQPEHSKGSPLDGSADGAAIKRYGADVIDIEASTSNAACLLLADNYYPGWRAFDNGQEVEIVRVDVAFRGLSLGPGKHNISFRYEPVPFKIGLWASLATLATIAALAAADMRRRFRETPRL